jgi:hypothetical protein
MSSFNIDSAIYTASVLGGKSNNVADFYTCAGKGNYDSSADNVISAAFAPFSGAGVLYASWEVGSGETWVPACCSTYVKVDMAEWW